MVRKKGDRNLATRERMIEEKANDTKKQRAFSFHKIVAPFCGVMDLDEAIGAACSVDKSVGSDEHQAQLLLHMESAHIKLISAKSINALAADEDAPLHVKLDVGTDLLRTTEETVIRNIAQYRSLQKGI